MDDVVGRATYTQRLVDITIYNLEKMTADENPSMNNYVIDVYTVDINLPAVRAWFLRTTIWATHNKYGVQVSPSKAASPTFFPKDKTYRKNTKLIKD